MIKAVIFDMYETLITHFECPLYFSDEMSADAGIPLDKFQAIWHPTEHDRSIGKVTLEEVVELILRENNRYEEALFQMLVEKRKATKKECFRHLHPEILPMLAELKNTQISIGLISNCFNGEAEVIRESELFPYFDAVCLSCEEGVRKPDKEIYHRCMTRLGVKPEECLYIGDGGSRELETAQELGMKAMQAAWYLKEGTKQPCGRKAEFEQLENPIDILKFL